MRIIAVSVALALVTLLAACSTPEERAAKSQERSYKAQEEVARERLRLVDEYQKCVKAAAGDAAKAEACETYLKAADALK